MKENNRKNCLRDICKIYTLLLSLMNLSFFQSNLEQSATFKNNCSKLVSLLYNFVKPLMQFTHGALPPGGYMTSVKKKKKNSDTAL